MENITKSKYHLILILKD